MTEAHFVPYLDRYVPDAPTEQAARQTYQLLAKRRTVRAFSDRPVSRETIEWLVRAAGGAPSGANKQPWRVVCVQDPELKRKIRAAADVEERQFCHSRAGAGWLKDLQPLGTDENKPYIEQAPWLIAVFKLTRGDDGSAVYYPSESVGIAVGLLLVTAHLAGLATVTHTPSPMGFLAQVLGRPSNERAFVLIPVGYPADDCQVPEAALHKKPLEEIMVVDRPA